MKKSNSVKMLTLFALFIAIELMMLMTPLGYLRIGPLSATLLHSCDLSGDLSWNEIWSVARPFVWIVFCMERDDAANDHEFCFFAIRHDWRDLGKLDFFDHRDRTSRTSRCLRRTLVPILPKENELFIGSWPFRRNRDVAAYDHGALFDRDLLWLRVFQRVRCGSKRLDHDAWIYGDHKWHDGACLGKRRERGAHKSDPDVFKTTGESESIISLFS